MTSPFLSLTGSQDQLSITPATTPQSRTVPFYNMPKGDKYLAWLDTASHMSFGGQYMRRIKQPSLAKAMGEAPPNQPHIDTVVKAVTTAFWLVYLEPGTAQGAAAKTWLASGGPNGILVAGDRWEVR